jgi:hypothetical protein
MKLAKVGIIALTAALSLAAQSCNKVNPQPEGSGYPILFNSADYNTKAIATEDNVKDGFKVYQWESTSGTYKTVDVEPLNNFSKLQEDGSGIYPFPVWQNHPLSWLRYPK